MVLCWTFLLACTPMFDMDVWWHLRTGQLIWEGKGIPVHDWFTVFDSGRAWIDLQWGFELLLAPLYAVGGGPALILLKAASLTLAVALAWFASGDRIPAPLKAACWLLPILAITGRGDVRPELLTLVFLATWLWVLSRV